MSFGKRRPKPTRAQLRPTNPIAIQQGRLARQRDRLARLAVVAVAVLVTAAIVHGSGSPFPFRLGQRPSRELRVNVPEFHRLNQKKTNAARQMVVDQVATSMINDPAPIRDLAGRLGELIVALTPSPAPKPFAKTVFPAPSSPHRHSRSPASATEARRAARACVTPGSSTRRLSTSSRRRPTRRPGATRCPARSRRPSPP